MKKIRVSAKNVQKAIEEGLKALEANQEEVDIKIIDEGGLFKKATVELTLDKEVEEKRQESEKSTTNSQKVEKGKKDNLKASKEDAKTLEKGTETCNADNSSGNSVTNNADEKVCENKEKVVKTKKEVDAPSLDNSNAISLGTSFLKGLFEKMGVEANLETVEQESGITFNASGENVSRLIGKRGETLNAIQDVLSNVLRNSGYRETRYYFDVENYKNRREISLVSLAERMANKAVKINKPIKLERMNAYERKIIHSHLQNFGGVTTKSEGEEPNRYLVIIPVKE